MKISNINIGKDYPPFIIAELSANHNGSILKAKETIKKAKEIGVSAIKIQTYTPDTMTMNIKSDDFLIKGGLWSGYYLYDLYQLAYTPFEWHKELFDFAKDQGIIIFSTPFDETAVDLLESLNTPAYKIASFEITDIPLIKKVARTNKPILISTGMASYDEINDAVVACRECNNNQIILLHCTSSYPAKISNANLNCIQTLKEMYGVQVGLSDHTLGTVVSTAAIALGAVVIEKHFILDRNEKGPDSEFSLEPDEFKDLCYNTSMVWSSLGEKNKPLIDEEVKNKIFRRSIYFSEDLKSGDEITKYNIRRIRPGFGMAPKYFDELIGKRVKKSIKKGTPVKWNLINE